MSKNCYASCRQGLGLKVLPTRGKTLSPILFFREYPNEFLSGKNSHDKSTSGESDCRILETHKTREMGKIGINFHTNHWIGFLERNHFRAKHFTFPVEILEFFSSSISSFSSFLSCSSLFFCPTSVSFWPIFASFRGVVPSFTFLSPFLALSSF